MTKPTPEVTPDITHLSHNPDAMAWATAFKQTFPQSLIAADEGLMVGWFANAMMAMHDHLEQSKIQPQQARIDELEALRHPIVLEIMAEVEKATRKFPTWPTRIIDAGNVVSEEAGELAKACLQVTYEKEKETIEGVRMEAIQTAAMCFRFLVSMDRYDTSPAEQHEQPEIGVN